MDRDGEELELRQEEGGLRHYLLGKPLHAGASVELLLEDGTWLPGRYEWSFRKEALPMFYLYLSGKDSTISVSMTVPQGAIWRRSAIK